MHHVPKFCHILNHASLHAWAVAAKPTCCPLMKEEVFSYPSFTCVQGANDGPHDILLVSGQLHLRRPSLRTVNNVHRLLEHASVLASMFSTACSAA